MISEEEATGKTGRLEGARPDHTAEMTTQQKRFTERNKGNERIHRTSGMRSPGYLVAMDMGSPGQICAVRYRAAQSMPRCMIVRASSTEKSAGAWPREQ